MKTHDPIPTTTSRGPTDSTATASSLEQRVRSLRLPAEAYTRSSSAKFAWFLCLVLAGVAGWLGMKVAKLQGEATGEESPSDKAVSGATSNDAARASSEARVLESESALESKGYVMPTKQILVSPKVSGVVVKLNIEEGQRVREGDILAQIEDTDYKADFERAEATLKLAEERLGELTAGNRPEEISQAQAELAEAKVQVDKLEADFRRATDLRRRNIISEEEFQDIDSKYRAQQRRVDRLTFAQKLMTDGPRQERIKAARAEVRQAQADVTKTKWRLDNCTILAPISGTILRKEAEEGNLVNPIAFSGSRSLCELADLSQLEVDLSIAERDISKVFKGQKCRVRPSDSYPDREYTGYVSRLMPIADRAKGAVSVRVKVTVPADEEGVYLKPELGVQVTFLKGDAKPAAKAKAKE